MFDRDYGDENDFNRWVEVEYEKEYEGDDEDEFYFDPEFWEDEDDDDEDLDDEDYGSLVRNEPPSSGPFLSTSAIVEEEHIFS